MTTETIEWHEVNPVEDCEMPKHYSEILIKNKFGQVSAGFYSGSHWLEGNMANNDRIPSKWVRLWAYMPKGPK